MRGAIVNINHLIRRSAPPSPHRGRNTGAAHCFIGCGRPKAFPLLPLWEAANQKPSLGGRWRLSRKAKTTDEGKVITITKPFLCNSPPPSSVICALRASASPPKGEACACAAHCLIGKRMTGAGPSSSKTILILRSFFIFRAASRARGARGLLW